MHIKQMMLYVWSVMCLMALVAGMPPPDSVTETSVSDTDDLLCRVFGGDECNKTPLTSTTISSTDSTKFKCVPFYLCDDNNATTEDGRGVLDLGVIDKECNYYDLRYCAESNIRSVENPVEVYIPGPKPPINPCGIRNTDGLGFRIIGTEKGEAQYGEFPWMVVVLQSSGQDNEASLLYQCGGSLLHAKVVLTAAHCVHGKENLVVRVGEYDVRSLNELYPTQDRKVRKIIIHEDYNNNSLINDAALLILEKPVDMTQPNVGLICLPPENENMDGRECIASGWGKNKFDMGLYNVVMRKIDLPIIPREPCLESLRTTKLSAKFELHRSFICAGGRPGKDTCTGDGGSPLVCPSKGDAGVYVQAGIVAWGVGCGTDIPAVYVNVPYFVPWIRSELEQHDIFLTCITSPKV